MKLAGGRRGAGLAAAPAQAPAAQGVQGASRRGHCSSSQVQPSRATIALEAGGPQTSETLSV